MDNQAGIWAVPGGPFEHEVGVIERAEEISPASVRLTIVEGKALLASLQEQVVTAQVQQHVASVKSCPQCGKGFSREGSLPVHSTFCKWQRWHANPTPESIPLLRIAGAQLLDAIHEQEPYHSRVAVYHGQDSGSDAVSKGR